MKKNLLASALLSFLLINAFTALADVRLPAIIGNHMVLQQATEVKLWGWCEPEEKIRITTTWDTTTYRATGSPHAKWEARIKTPAGGGPHTITINGNNKIVLEDVLIGEVWLGSGQSNMEMNYSWGVKEYKADMEAAGNKNIRFFHIPRLSADYPQDDTKGKWVVCTPEEAGKFSLVAYFFGRQLHQALNVPVGLIASSWGGTPAEVWTPADTIQKHTPLKEAAARLEPRPWWPILPGLTYNAMIHPITSYTIAGALWYQGEANVGAAANYKELLPALIASWRKAWGKELPFYYVQIAPFAGYGNSTSSALLREAQATVLRVPHTGMVVTHDLVDDINDIHPKIKKEVGHRLAANALAQTYGKSGVAYRSPLYKSIRVEKDRVRIYFEGADKGLVSKGGALTDFYIAGDDKVFVKADARIDGNTVLVSSKSVKKPVAVRFGFTNAAMPNLYSKEGLPVAIFRTDDWTEVNTTAAK